MIENILVGFVILLLVAVAIAKIVSEKRKGNKCIGCPYGESGCTDKNCK